MAVYGKKTASGVSPDSAVINAGVERESVFNVMTEHGWGYQMVAHVGKPSGGGNPDVVMVVRATDAAKNPTALRAYTGVTAVSAVMVSGNDPSQHGTDITAAILVSADDSPVNSSVMLWSGQRYGLGVNFRTNNGRHGMYAAAVITGDNEQFYNKTGVTSSPPPDPMAYSAPSVEGWVTVAIDYDPNVSPQTPSTGMAPTGTITSTVPTFTADFRDGNASHSGTDRGDMMKSYRIILYDSAGTTVIWDSGDVAASSAEQAADAVAKVYSGPALVQGTSYKWTVAVKDLFGATSSFSAQQSFTISSAGFVTLDGTPSGKTEIYSGQDFQWRWNHASALAANRVQIAIFAGSSPTPLHTSGEISHTVASSALPGTLDTVTWAESGFNAVLVSLTPGAEYQYAVRGRDTSSVWSAYSARRSFRPNARPTTPTSLFPSGVVTALPDIRFLTSDADDAQGTDLLGYVSSPEFFGITNPDFVTNTTHWGAATQVGSGLTFTGARATDQTGDGNVGAYKFAVTVSAAAIGVYLHSMHDENQPVTPGHASTFHERCFTSNTGLVPLFRVTWKDAALATISTEVQPVYTPATANVWFDNVWTKLPPVNAAYALIGIVTWTRVTNTIGNVYHWKVGLGGFRQATWDAGIQRFKYTVNALDAPYYQVYTFKTWGWDGTIEGPDSDQGSFTFVLGPTVTMVYPTADQVITEVSPLVDWTYAGTNTQQKYRVRIWETIGNVPGVLDPTKLVYQTGTPAADGIVTSSTSQHQVDAGSLHDDRYYQLIVEVWDTTGLYGTTPGWGFGINFPPPASVNNFIAGPVMRPGDSEPTAIVLSWDASATAGFFKYILTYKKSSDTAWSVLKEFDSAADVTYFHQYPSANVEYNYAIVQVVTTEGESNASDPAYASATATFTYTVINELDEPDDYRVVVRWWTSRRFPIADQDEEVALWNAPDPALLTSNFKPRTVEISAQFIDDENGASLDKVTMCQTLRIRSKRAVYRDAHSRVLLGVLRKADGGDEPAGNSLRTCDLTFLVVTGVLP